MGGASCMGETVLGPSVVLGSEFCGRDPHRVYRFLELSLTLLPLPEAGIEHRFRDRYFLQISQRQRRAFIDSSGDLWQSRSCSRFILSDGLTGRKPSGFCPFFSHSVVAADRREAGMTFNHRHLLFEKTSSPRENSVARPVVTFLS